MPRKERINHKAKKVPETPQHILNFFKNQYPILKDVQLEQIDEVRLQKYHGYALFTLDYLEEMGQRKNKTRQRKVLPYKIFLNFQLQQKTYVLLHQISHCLAPYVEREVKNEWVYLQHEREFYVQLMQILEIANNEGIYNKKFENINDLMKFDRTV